MNGNSYTPSGPGVVSRYHRNSTGSLHQPTTSNTSTPNYVHEPLTSEHSRTQVQHKEHPYHHWEQERPASSQQGTSTVARPHLHLPLPPPVVQVPPAPNSAPASLGKTQLSHPPPPQSPMSVHSNGQPAPRSVAAATIPAGQDDRNRSLSLSQPAVTNAMPPQVPGLNFQYDQNGSYRSQYSHQHSFTPNLPLSQPTNHVPSHSTRPPMDYLPAAPTQTRVVRPSSRQNSIDLSHPMPPPAAGQHAPQSTSHTGRQRRGSLCSGFCPPNCSTPHTLSSPVTLTFQPGHSTPTPPLPPRSAPSQPSEPRALHGIAWGSEQPPIPPPPPTSQQRPPQQPPPSLPSRQPSLQHQAPPQQTSHHPLPQPLPPQQPQQPLPPSQPRPPQPVAPPQYQYPPQQFVPPSQPHQSLPPQQPVLPQQPQHHLQRPPSQSAQPTSQPIIPISVPASDNAVNGTAAASPSGPRHMNAEQYKQVQAVIHNEAMMAALEPLQGGVEQLWSQTVNQFSTVLNQVLSCQLDTIQSDRARMAKIEGMLKDKEDENLSLLEQRATWATKLSTSAKEAENMRALIRSQSDALLASQKEADKMRDLVRSQGDTLLAAQKEAENMGELIRRQGNALLASQKEADGMGALVRSQGDALLAAQKEAEGMSALVKSQGDAISAAQEEVAKLAAEKGRLEVELSSVQDVRYKVADSGTKPSTELVTILLQQEIALQVERKLREAQKEVEEHRVAREQAEKQLTEMKQKLKVLVGFDIGELEKHPPSREATVVGSPPPKSATHSRRSSRDIPTSWLPVTPLPPPSLPPSSAPSSPLVLRAAPPIQRRPSPVPHLPTPPIAASVLTSISGKGTPEETSRSTSVPSRPTPSRSVSTLVPVVVPDANENGVVAGVKRPRPGQFDEDSGEPVPVRRLTVDSEGPRRDAFQSRDGSRPPSGRAPVPIASVPVGGRSNEAELAMEVDRPQQPALQSPAPAPCPQRPLAQPPATSPCPQQPLIQSPAPAPPTPASLLAAASTATVPDAAPNVAKGEPATEERGDGTVDEEVVIKFEDEVDQLMEELVNFDDEPEEGEVMETDEECAIRSSPVPQPSNNAASEPSAPAPRLPSLPPNPAAPLPPPGQPGQQQQPDASPYAPPARSWARAYPNRPPQKSWSRSSSSADTSPSCLSKPVKEDPSAPKLSVMKHWVLLYIDDGTEWKCRLCQTMPNAGRPRAVFHKKTSSHEAMLQHSQTEHPVACADMAKLSNDKLAEMKARLPPQGRQ